MKVKNAINSETCKELRLLIGITNSMITRIEKIANDVDEMHKANGLLSQVQKILCQRFGEQLNDTLLVAQDIEAQTKEEVHSPLQTSRHGAGVERISARLTGF